MIVRRKTGYIAIAATLLSGSTQALAGEASPSKHFAPSLWSVLPFVLLLLAIAILPLLGPVQKFWHKNRNKLLVALVLSIPVAAYYYFAFPPYGLAALAGLFRKSLLEEFFPFIVLLLSLFTISGGISLTGDLRAHPITNTMFLAVGAVLANLIGTTGASMVLIRPLLQTNQERRHIRHTVIFFIFLVCNIGGCLTPLGDPPLFLGYLKGVPFAWTLRFWPEWLFTSVLLLAIYYIWERRAYHAEGAREIQRDETEVQPLRLAGKINFLYLIAVVAAVAFLVPGQHLPGVGLTVPKYLREAAMLVLAGLSMLTTPRGVRRDNQFHFGAIAEVAALFLGIFITMQLPIEILKVKGSQLGVSQPWEFFWATGALSSFLDNTPTYAVFLELGSVMSRDAVSAVALIGDQIRPDLLTAISLGAVFMGANTYIGNGPNFMVKAIAEDRGVKMPGFFGYMIYSSLVLVPLFILVTLVFFTLGWQ